MRDHEAELAKRGTRPVVISTGSPRAIPDFRSGTGFQGEILTDPSRATFEALGFVRGVVRTFEPRAALAALRALGKGFFQGRTRGDPWQQGGVIAVRPGGEILFQYRSRYAGDHPAPEAFLAALPPVN